MIDATNQGSADQGAATYPDDATVTGGAPGQPPSLESSLKPGQPLHTKLLSRFKARLELAERNKKPRYDAYDRVDEKRRLYVNLDRPARRGNRTDDATKKENPFERSLVMPVSYAIHQTRLAQMVTAFDFRSPFYQLDGRGIEDIKPAKLMEMKLEYDYQQSDGRLAVYQVLQDADAYGVGILYDYWDEVPGWQQIPPDPIMAALSQQLGLPPPEPTSQYGIIKQFTRWAPVDPYMFWADPRVTAGRLQESEFVGHRSYRSWLWLFERSIENGGSYFNLDELKKSGSGAGQGGETRIASRNRASENQQFQLRDGLDENDRGFYVIDSMQIRLIPSEWGLGPEKQPQIWCIVVADERVIIRAHPSPYQHGEFTYAVGEVGYDIHQYANPGIIEDLDGLQRTIDWLANSRIDNVKKFLNDMLIFSPELVEEDDVLHPGSARWIRLTEAGTLAAMQGVTIQQMIQQIPVQDMTGPHFEIIQLLMDMANKLGASNDPMQGQEMPEKRTLGEIQEVIKGGSQRLSVTSMILDAMIFKPLGMRAIMNAQQFYDIQQWVRVVGDYAEIDPEGLGRIQMSKSDLSGNFDYVPMTALTPQDPARSFQVWSGLYNTALTNLGPLSTPDPLDPTVLDVKGLFKMIARFGGAREVDALFRQLPQMVGPGQAPPQVASDQQVDQGLQEGSLAPAESGPPQRYGGPQ